MLAQSNFNWEVLFPKNKNSLHFPWQEVRTYLSSRKLKETKSPAEWFLTGGTTRAANWWPLLHSTFEMLTGDSSLFTQTRTTQRSIQVNEEVRGLSQNFCDIKPHAHSWDRTFSTFAPIDVNYSARSCYILRSLLPKWDGGIRRGFQMVGKYWRVLNTYANVNHSRFLCHLPHLLFSPRLFLLYFWVITRVS